MEYPPYENEVRPNVIREFYETKEFERLYKEVSRKHDRLGRNGEPYLVCFADYMDKHEVFKGSLEAYMITILNLKRSIRNLPFMQLLVAELPGLKEDIHNVRKLLLEELLTLNNGVQIYCSREHGTRWVYAIITAQVADSQEQYKNASSKAPGGRTSRHACPCCMATRANFARLESAPRRCIETTRRSIEMAARSRNQAEAARILDDVGVSLEALKNPMFWLLEDVFRSQPRDILHMLFWDMREPLKHLLSTTALLTKRNTAILEARIILVRGMKIVHSRIAPRPLSVSARWKGYEHLNFLLFSGILLEGLVPQVVQD